jgi:hypothetical protein
MPSTYPTALDNIAADKSNATTSATDHPDHHNELADAINAVQTALGVNLGNVAGAGAPASAAAAAVAAHVDAADPHTQYTTAAEAAAAAPVQSVAGRTGNVTLAKADVGLGNVDDTSDANKPVSTATQTALNDKANTAHTHAIGDVTGLQTALDGKQPLSTVLNNTTASFTTAQETKLAGIAAGATVNATDAALRDRATHTGAQAASTISDFAAAADARIAASNRVSSNTTGITGADQITNMVSLTQAEYDAIGTKNASTLYVIAG